MFLTYLRRELRRRSKQAILIAAGLAVGVGLVITVTAASAGVKNAQAQVLHSLYGVGTDITVTQAPAAGTGGPGSFRFGSGASGGFQRPAAGTTFTNNRLSARDLAAISAAKVTSIQRLSDVAGASGALVLNDVSISGTIPSSAGSGSGTGGAGGGFGSVTPTVFTVDGVSLTNGAVGPLASGRLVSGRTFKAGDSTANVALVNSDYAAQNKLKAGSTVAIGDSSGNGTTFTIIGVVSLPSGSSTSDYYIPLSRAQALSGMSNDVNTIYVAARGSTQIPVVSKQIGGLLPKATVTTASSLASQVSGSVASSASLVANLGKWLAVAVLIAAFALASLLTSAAVSRRVREFGTLKALGWKSRRIVAQVLGESVVIGVVGGIVGVGLGYLGAGLIGKFAPPLSASLGTATGSATPGGPQVFGGGPPGGAAGTGRGGFFGPLRQAADAAPHVTVHLTAPVALDIIGIAVALAVLGGLLAGGLGGWRAARLRPAAALARVA